MTYIDPIAESPGRVDLAKIKTKNKTKKKQQTNKNIAYEFCENSSSGNGIKAAYDFQYRMHYMKYNRMIYIVNGQRAAGKRANSF